MLVTTIDKRTGAKVKFYDVPLDELEDFVVVAEASGMACDFDEDDLMEPDGLKAMAKAPSIGPIKMSRAGSSPEDDPAGETPRMTLGSRKPKQARQSKHGHGRVI